MRQNQTPRLAQPPEPRALSLSLSLSVVRSRSARVLVAITVIVWPLTLDATAKRAINEHEEGPRGASSGSRATGPRIPRHSSISATERIELAVFITGIPY